MQIYSNPKRANDPHALPDVEVFQLTAADLSGYRIESETFAGLVAELAQYRFLIKVRDVPLEEDYTRAE